jgi:hypothetical protein
MSFKAQQLQAPFTRSTVIPTLTGADLSATPTSAIIPSSAGTLTCQLIDDSADRAIEVLAGVTYPFRVKSINASTVPVIVALFNDS